MCMGKDCTFITFLSSKLAERFFVREVFQKLITQTPPPTVGQEADELIYQNARKTKQNETLSL